MFRRLVALVLLALLPSGAALALPDAPAQTAPATVTGALLDQVTKSAANPQTNRAQGLGNVSLSFHDDTYQYALLVCADASLVEVDGRTIEPSAFVPGDTITVSIKPNPAATAKSCVGRVVRQKISRGASGGECLQDYQVKQEIDGHPAKILIQTDYAYLLSVYARPTLDCDGKAYGSAPITTVIAPNKPFVVVLTRDTPSGQKELKRWSLTTDANGKASFNYIFAVASDSYKFTLMPGTVSSPGDELSWTANAIDPRPAPSTSPASRPIKVSPVPIIIMLVIIMLAAGGAEYWHWVRKQRDHELPEDEYNRTSKL